MAVVETEDRRSFRAGGSPPADSGLAPDATAALACELVSRKFGGTKQNEGQKQSDDSRFQGV